MIEGGVSRRASSLPEPPETANVLNKVALSVQINMKIDLREIYGASTRAAAEAAIGLFADKYNAKHDKAVAYLDQGPGSAARLF